MNFLAFREAWQLSDNNASAGQILEIYDQVKKGGRQSVEGDAWNLATKVVRSLTPHEVTDFQQMWLATDDGVRAAAVGEEPPRTAPGTGRARCGRGCNSREGCRS